MNERMLRYLHFSMIPGFGVVSQNRLLKLCDGIEGCFEKNAGELLQLDGSAGPKQRIGERRLLGFLKAREDPDLISKAEAVARVCEEKGIAVITEADEAYPQRFSGLGDMPVVLYVKGSLQINRYERSVAIVGARRCSREGKDAAIATACREVREGSAIISGMAKGIDSYAHTAAVMNGGYTIAVLGSGPDICYPEEHRKLYEEIIRHGCILSEYPPGTIPKSYRFPRRNRLIAALSDELYVVDAGRHSGTETTVQSGRKYGRICG